MTSTAARSLLENLRVGNPPTPTEIRAFIKSLTAEQLDDAQIGAFCMGVCRCPLSNESRVALTTAMRDSGRKLSWDLPGPVINATLLSFESGQR